MFKNYTDLIEIDKLEKNNSKKISWLELILVSLLILITSITIYLLYCPLKKSDFSVLKVSLNSVSTLENLKNGKKVSFNTLKENGYVFQIPSTYLKDIKNLNRFKTNSKTNSLHLMIFKNEYNKLSKSTQTYLFTIFKWNTINVYGIKKNRFILLDLNSVINAINNKRIFYLSICIFHWIIFLFYSFLDRKLLN